MSEWASITLLASGVIEVGGTVNKLTAYNVAKVSNLTWSVDHKGYYHSYVVVGGKRYNILRHVLNFYKHNGYIPKVVDHIDGIPGNDEPSNLREADKSRNMCNAKVRSDNKSGVKGVTWYPKTDSWKVSVTLNGKSYHGGYFKDLELARESSKELRERLHKSFARMS